MVRTTRFAHLLHFSSPRTVTHLLAFYRIGLPLAGRFGCHTCGSPRYVSVYAPFCTTGLYAPTPPSTLSHLTTFHYFITLYSAFCRHLTKLCDGKPTRTLIKASMIMK